VEAVNLASADNFELKITEFFIVSVCYNIFPDLGTARSALRPQVFCFGCSVLGSTVRWCIFEGLHAVRGNWP